MPKKPRSHIQDPDRITLMHANGDGFFAPIPPHREAVVAYLRLYNETRAGWDLPPELGVLRNPYGDTVSGYALPIPDGTWAAFEDPMRVVRKVASLLWEQGRTDHPLVRGIDRSLLADMVGVYFMHEGWAPPKGKEREAVNLMRNGMGYRLADTADRRETRSVIAVQVDGVLHLATQHRDAPRDTHVKSYDPTRDEEGCRIGGTMPRPLLEVAYGLIQHMRPTYANDPQDNL